MLMPTQMKSVGSFVFILIGFVLIELAIILFLLFSGNMTTDNSELNKLLNEQTERLEKSNKQIDKTIDSLKSELNKTNLQLETINKQKQSIRLIYVDKIKSIDGYNNDDIVDQFNVFFSKKNNSKQ